MLNTRMPCAARSGRTPLRTISRISVAFLFVAIVLVSIVKSVKVRPAGLYSRVRPVQLRLLLGGACGACENIGSGFAENQFCGAVHSGCVRQARDRQNGPD